MPSVADNPRGVLSGHVEGILNGMFLIIVGLMADRVRLSARASAVCVGLLLYGTFVNWITSTTAGILGTSQATPIAGAGHHAAPVIEQVVMVVSVTVGIAMILAVRMLLFRAWARQNDRKLDGKRDRSPITGDAGDLKGSMQHWVSFES